MPQPARERIRAAMAADSPFRRLVEGMQADRVALASMARAHAPADLLARVEAELSAADLRSLAGVEATVPGPLQVSRVEYEGPSVLGALGGVLASVVSSRWPRWVAAAAVLALFGGIALVGARAVLKKIDTRTTVVKNTGPVDPPPAPTPEPDSAREVAGAETLSAPSLADPAPALALNPPSPEAPETGPTPVARTPLYGMELARAMELAGQNRLMVRLRSLTTEDARRNLDRRSDRFSRVAYAEALPEHLARVLAARLPTLPGPAHAGPDQTSPGPGSEPGWPALASANPLLSNPELPVTLATTLQAARRRSAEVYAARFDSRVGLAELLRELARGKDMAIDLIELPAPLAAPEAPSTSSVLWWSSSSTWDRPLAAPIVIETP